MFDQKFDFLPNSSSVDRNFEFNPKFIFLTDNFDQQFD